ncbi:GLYCOSYLTRANSFERASE [Salix purpurea]|uniref:GLYCOSYLTRANSFERASE n=1 Tax=Salix purpurea TaxID=77065 RepID=A0A9Q0PQE7_SALPP|nr:GLYCOSYLTRANSFERASE [Salix purpurea]
MAIIDPVFHGKASILPFSTKSNRDFSFDDVENFPVSTISKEGALSSSTLPKSLSHFFYKLRTSQPRRILAFVSDMDAVTAKPTYSSHVVAIPYPGRGHVNPLMNFCNILASKQPDTLVTFVVTEEWLGLISSSSNNSPSNLQFLNPKAIPSICLLEIEKKLPNDTYNTEPGAWESSHWK